MARNRRRTFHTLISQNRFRLRMALVVYFVLAVLAGQATGRAFMFVAEPDRYYEQPGDPGPYQDTGPITWLLDYSNQVTLAVMLLAWVNYRRMVRHGDRIILSLVDAQPLKDRQFVNTGAEMVIAAGIDMPRMWIIESDDLNAFACAPANGPASIAITRGLLERLPREQIQAVVGHEMAHIKNGDAQLMTVLLGLGRVFHLISAFALGPLRALFDAGLKANRAKADEPDNTEANPPAPKSPMAQSQPMRTRNVVLLGLATPFLALAVLALSVVVSLTLVLGFGLIIRLFPYLVGALAVWEGLRDQLPTLDQWARNRFSGLSSGASALLILMPVGLIVGPAILVLGVLVPVMLLLMRFNVSRNREYQADAVAVELTRNPGALRAALQTLRAARGALLAPSLLPFALAPLTIVSAQPQWVFSVPWLGWIRTLISTHPPLDERLRRLAEMEGTGPFRTPT